jgi:hypothetical protein
MKCFVRASATALFALAISLPVSVKADDPPLALVNPGLEGAYYTVTPAPGAKGAISGALPQGWQDDSGWADVTVNYTQEVVDVHEGKSALKVDVTAIRGGACQFMQYFKQITQGHTYTFTVWLKGDGKVPIDVYLRRSTAPYTIYGKSSIIPNATWQKVTVVSQATDTLPAALMIRPGAPTTFTIDDAAVTDTITAPK